MLIVTERLLPVRAAHESIVCRVRISLGLKPLSMENSADTQRKEVEAKRKVQREQQQAAEAAALADRVQK